MENILQTILKKLEGIDFRLKSLETNPNAIKVSGAPAQAPRQPIAAEPKDVLCDKAWDIISKNKDEEISSEYIAKAMGIDEKRVEKIFDQLENAGYGASSWKEV
ncbi:MAG: hypothetical protein Q7R95_07865 [bacterium]|nr:hypothetical protein [bacterium]